LGRHFIGIEIDPEYVSIARDKLEKVKETIFQGYFVSYFLGKIQSIRDIDSTKIFPHQLTSVEKKRLRENGNNGYKAIEDEEIFVIKQAQLLEKRGIYKT
jgi:hypothetical protein